MKKKSINYQPLILGIEGVLSKNRCSFSENEKDLLKMCICEFKAISEKEAAESEVNIELLTMSVKLLIQLAVAAHTLKDLI